jgi:hypothetical protein
MGDFNTYKPEFEEKLEAKIFLNGQEIGHMILGKPGRDTHLVYDWHWYATGNIYLNPKFCPYHASVSIHRPDNDKINVLMKKAIDDQNKPPGDQPGDVAGSSPSTGVKPAAAG